MNDSNAIHDSVKGLVLVCVVVAHGVALIAVSHLHEPKHAHSNEFVSALFFVDERKRKESPPLKERKPKSERSRQMIVPEIKSTDDSVPASTITNWSSQREKTAGDVVGREAERANARSLFSKPRVLDLSSRESAHSPGDMQRVDGAEIIYWINDRCYSTNLPPPGPQLIPDRPNVICKNKDQPLRADFFDYLKPDYLRDPNAVPTNVDGIFSDKTQCERSAAHCD